MKECRICGRKLRNWRSVRKGIGPTCEQKYLSELYEQKQISIDDLLKQQKNGGD